MAKLKLAEQIRIADRVDPTASRTANLKRLIQQFELTFAGLSPSTTYTRKCWLNVLRSNWPFSLDCKVAEITPAHLQSFVAQERQRLKASSANDLITKILRPIFKLAVQMKVISESPAERLKLFKTESPLRPTPTWQQFQDIVRTVQANRFTDDAENSAALIEFMGLVGVGQAEAAGLCGEHISFERKEIQFFRQKTRVGFTVPLFPQVQPLLEKLREEGRVATGKPVFQIKNPKKALAAACRKLGLPSFSPRSLRRTFIVRCLERGVDARMISRWQAHGDNGVLIMKVYSRFINPAHAQRMAALLC